MHPLLERRERVLLYVATWVALAILMTFLVVNAIDASWGEGVLLVAPLASALGYICLSPLYLCRALSLASVRVPRVVGTHAFAAAVSASVWLLMGWGYGSVLQNLGLARLGDEEIRLLLVPFFGIGFLLYALSSVVHYLILAFEEARTAEREALEVQVLAREAELKVLRAQLHPHFLFNSLNSVNALIITDSAAARSMLIRLAEFLRSTIAIGSSDGISLREEMKLAESFLAIEQVRFGPRLSFSTDVDDACGSCLVPPLLLQPLVENAVNHGIARCVEGGTVRLKGYRRRSTVHILVQNPVDSTSRTEVVEGVGLQNVRKRLVTMYGVEAGIVVRSADDVFTVEVALPAQEQGEG